MELLPQAENNWKLNSGGGDYSRFNVGVLTIGLTWGEIKIGVNGAKTDQAENQCGGVRGRLGCAPVRTPACFFGCLGLTPVSLGDSCGEASANRRLISDLFNFRPASHSKHDR